MKYRVNLDSGITIDGETLPLGEEFIADPETEATACKRTESIEVLVERGYVNEVEADLGDGDELTIDLDEYDDETDF